MHHNTLAGALGIGFFPIAYYALVRLRNRFWNGLIGLFVVPFATLIGYWGFDCYGLMKDCGHGLLLIPTLLGLVLIKNRLNLIKVLVGFAIFEFFYIYLKLNFEVHFKTFNWAVLGTLIVVCAIISSVLGQDKNSLDGKL